MKKIISILSIVCFLFSISAITSCSSKKSTTKPRVKSGSGMGNSKHKNRHVWGK